MDVQVRKCFLKRATEIDIVPPVHAGRKTRLHAYLAGAQFMGFARAPDHFLGRKKIAFLAQMAAAERAETAGLHANISEIDVSIDDVGYDVADGFGAEIIRGRSHADRSEPSASKRVVASSIVISEPERARSRMWPTAELTEDRSRSRAFAIEEDSWGDFSLSLQQRQFEKRRQI